MSDRPIILVQGDTTTTFIAGLAAYYLKIKIGHIEAGLRTNDKFNPFPEEINRRLTDCLSDYYFVHTKKAGENLLDEGVHRKKIFYTGNTERDVGSGLEILHLVIKLSTLMESQRSEVSDYTSFKTLLKNNAICK